MVKAIIRKSVSNTTSSSTSSSSSSSVLDGKVRKQQPDHEQVEIQMYLSKLRELVPNMPKNRKVSKVEVINNVIDYICDLQTALIDQLHQHPAASTMSVLNNNNNNNVVNGCVHPILMMETSTTDCPTC